MFNLKTDVYIACRNTGMTYQQIADRFGVSKQNVHCCVKKHGGAINVRSDAVVFPGLRRWMEANHVRIAELERRSGVKLRRELRVGRLNSAKINAVLGATGLSYEEAFGVTADAS